MNSKEKLKNIKKIVNQIKWAVINGRRGRAIALSNMVMSDKKHTPRKKVKEEQC